MTGPLLAAQGNTPAPSYAFASDTTTGFYLASTGQLGLSTAGSLAALFNSNQTVTWTNTQTAPAFQTSSGGVLVPVGTIAYYAGSTAPSGWQLCGGQAISRTTYSALFAVIGTTYGSGDGSTTFTLPDCRGRGMYGRDNMSTGAANRITVAGGNFDGTVLGNTGGGQNQTLVSAQLPIITPTFTGNQINLGTIASNETNVDIGINAITVATGGSNAVQSSGPVHITIPAFTPSGTVSSFGSGASHPVINPAIIFNIIIFSSVP